LNLKFETLSNVTKYPCLFLIISTKRFMSVLILIKPPVEGPIYTLSYLFDTGTGL